MQLHSQAVSLDQKEIKMLKGMTTQKGTDAARLYNTMVNVANRTLNELPHPIDTIRSEGLLQGDPKKTATQLALRDMNSMYALALVYRVEREKKYLQKAEALLMGWTRINHSGGDPIDDTNLEKAIEAYDLVKESLGAKQRDSIREWLRASAQAELGGRYYRPERPGFFNNWNSHRLKIVGMIAYAIGDTALQRYTIEGLKMQLEKNLNPDGSSIDFTSRDALHYHVYDLEPLLRLCIVLQRATGNSYYQQASSTGASIQKSVEWLLPYLDGRKTHAEFVNSTVDFDRRRAQNNEAAYKAGTLFEPKNGIASLTLACYFDQNLVAQMDQLLTREKASLPWQAVLNNVMRLTAPIK